MPNRRPIGDPTERPAGPVDVVRASIDIAAPAADVFRALVAPRELAAWLGGEPMPTDPRDEQPEHQSYPLPGSGWHAPAVAPDGTSGTVTGEYQLVLPPRVLETTWRASWNDFATERVRFQLAPIDVGGVTGTRVTVTHTRAEARLLAPSSAFVGTLARADLWPVFLTRLAAHVATASALARWSGRDTSPNDSFDALHRAVVDLHHAR
jgi:uncharacterized protein YndB with AHSA1/START domain